MGNALIAGTAVSILLTVLVSAFLEPLCTLFGATKNIMPYALDYGQIIAIGFPFVIVAVIINATIRVDGSPKFAMFSMMAGAIVNIILDPIFIFILDMGVAGAVLATIISQLINLLLNITYIFRYKTIKLNKDSFHFKPRLVGRLASLGFASCLSTMTSTLVAMVSNNLMKTYGAMSVYGADIPITTFGLCMKVSMLLYSVALGVASGSQPILGFNYGAQKYTRVKKTFLLTLGVSTIIMTAAWIIYQCFPLQLIRIFGKESALYEEFAVKCFRIYLLTHMIGGVQLCAGIFFQSLGQPMKATVISLAKQVLFYVPAMLILAKCFGIIGILWAGPAAELLAFLLAGFFSIREIKSLNRLSAQHTEKDSAEDGAV